MNETGPPPRLRPAHRPLSDWIARVRTTGPGLGAVNDGSERTDARTMRRFTEQAWTRTSAVVTWQGEARRALALRAPDGTTVVELDDFGGPVPVSEAGAALVARLESAWDALPADPATVAVLRAESPALRYFLLHRAARETHAPPELFHCLPWERVTATADSAAALLRAEAGEAGAGAVPPPAGGLRHWFAPAAAPLAGPLQVLEAGLRSGRPGPWFGREAAHLLSGVLAAETARLPRSARHALAGLADALAAADRALHHSASLAATRLRGTGAVAPVAFRRRLDPDFVLRSSSGAPAAHRTEIVEDWPVTTGLTVTAGGLLEIETEIEDDPAPPARRLADGPLFHPVTLRPATDGRLRRPGHASLDGVERLPGFPVRLRGRPRAGHHLRSRPGRAAPTAALPGPGPPPAELEVSLPANERVTLSQWHHMIDGLPPHHPAHAALAAYEAAGAEDYCRALVRHSVLSVRYRRYHARMDSVDRPGRTATPARAQPSSPMCPGHPVRRRSGYQRPRGATGRTGRPRPPEIQTASPAAPGERPRAPAGGRTAEPGRGDL
ncbi:hypothetical protein ACGFZB_21595 [Streptomyces cinerochromogenes]|uniref:Uncharacterized protein n=1 Tax=Streptomyces cinerochromogenes TaxID=66422 RepID=A0ABW7B772_9ACTN